MSRKRTPKLYCELSPDSDDGVPSPAPQPSSRLKRRRKSTGAGTVSVSPVDAAEPAPAPSPTDADLPAAVSNTYDLCCDEEAPPRALEKIPESSANGDGLGAGGDDAVDFVPDSLEEAAEDDEGAAAELAAVLVNCEKPVPEEEEGGGSKSGDADVEGEGNGVEDEVAEANDVEGAKDGRGGEEWEEVDEIGEDLDGDAGAETDSGKAAVQEEDEMLPMLPDEPKPRASGRAAARRSKLVISAVDLASSSDDEEEEDDDADEASEYGATEDSDSEFEDPAPKARGKRKGPRPVPKPKTAAKAKAASKVEAPVNIKAAARPPAKASPRLVKLSPKAAVATKATPAGSATASTVKQGRGLCVRRPLISSLNTPRSSVPRPSSGGGPGRPRIRAGLSKLARVAPLHPNLKKS
jgi:hypothetical protein